MEVSQSVLNFQFICLGISIGSIATVIAILGLDKLSAAQHSVQLTAFGARLAWLFFGFILLLAMVLIIGGN